MYCIANELDFFDGPFETITDATRALAAIPEGVRWEQSLGIQACEEIDVRQGLHDFLDRYDLEDVADRVREYFIDRESVELDLDLRAPEITDRQRREFVAFMFRTFNVPEKFYRFKDEPLSLEKRAV